MASQKSQNGSLVYIFTYLLTWLSGIIVYITIGQKDKRLKFHSLQAMMLGVVMFVMFYIPVINLLGWILWLYGLYVGWQGYEGNDIEMPVIGSYARQYAK